MRLVTATPPSSETLMQSTIDLKNLVQKISIENSFRKSRLNWIYFDILSIQCEVASAWENTSTSYWNQRISSVFRKNMSKIKSWLFDMIFIFFTFVVEVVTLLFPKFVIIQNNPTQNKPCLIKKAYLKWHFNFFQFSSVTIFFLGSIFTIFQKCSRITKELK